MSDRFKATQAGGLQVPFDILRREYIMNRGLTLLQDSWRFY